MNNQDFWFFQIKDLATILVGLASFLTAFANLRSSYLRKAKIEIRLDRDTKFGRIDTANDLICIKTVHLFNRGAQSALVDDIFIKIWKYEKRLYIFDIRRYVAVLDWRGFSITENIAEKGAPRKLFTRMIALAAAVVVPKYDIVTKQIDFRAENNVHFMEGRYYFQMYAAVNGSKKKFIESEITNFYISEENITYLNENTLLVDGVRGGHLEFKRNSGGRDRKLLSNIR